MRPERRWRLRRSSLGLAGTGEGSALALNSFCCQCEDGSSGDMGAEPRDCLTPLRLLDARVCASCQSKNTIQKEKIYQLEYLESEGQSEAVGCDQWSRSAAQPPRPGCRAPCRVKAGRGPRAQLRSPRQVRHSAQAPTRQPNCFLSIICLTFFRKLEMSSVSLSF